MAAVQLRMTVIGVWPTSSTGELTRKRWPSAETAYRFGASYLTTSVWKSGLAAPASKVAPAVTSTAINFLSAAI